METLKNKTLEFENAVENAWDETDAGKAIIIKLLEKSQKDSREGKGRPYTEFMAEFELKLKHREYAL